MAYETKEHRVAIRGTGGRLTYISGFKSLSNADGCNSVSSGAIVEERLSGEVRLLKVFADVICNDLPVTYRPIAIIERVSYACWLGERVYEDGIEYLLDRPAPDGVSADEPCVIR